jgi:hypothetical protein
MTEHLPTPLKWSLFRQARDLLAAGACEYSIWLDGQIVIMADPAFGNTGEIETVVRLANEHDVLTKALAEIRAHLGAALVQTIDSDDQIIVDHVRKAHELAGGKAP